MVFIKILLPGKVRVKVLICIPARYGSTRMPAKVLAKDTGKFLIQHTYERACLAKLPGKVIIAADDKRIAEAFSCRTKTVENIRQRLVTEGFDVALDGRKREAPPRKYRLDGHQEAEVIALRLGKPPAGFANWSLRLLAEKVVELEIVDSVSHETVRQALKKTA